VHLTVGVLSTTWYDVLSDAVSLAGNEPAFREALPMQPTAGLGAALPDLLRRAAAWLEALPPAELETVVAARLARAVPPEPLALLAQSAAIHDLGPTTALRPRRGVAATLTVDGDRVRLQLPDRQVDLPLLVEPALRRLLADPSCPEELQVGDLDAEGALVLARRMLREGVVVPQ
ncbi:MAG: cupin, partial [Actinobacteria bacterium]|nr:cupin [Actinomycetota bacterium]